MKRGKEAGKKRADLTTLSPRLPKGRRIREADARGYALLGCTFIGHHCRCVVIDLLRKSVKEAIVVL